MKHKLCYFDPAPSESQTLRADLCIYGGVSGGAIAAIEACRRGLSVILLEPSRHLGGMTTGGLSKTDVGSDRVVGAIGGLSREFYRRVGARYNTTDEWNFEPRVAEEVLESWLAETSTRVLRQQFIDSVRKENGRITALRTVSGLVVEARMFIDASYEGDLMARAGVSYRVGREANSVYGETFDGMQIRDNRIAIPVSAWLVPGVPSKGFLPGVEAGDDYTPGTGDHRIQAYNFRICVTNRPDLRRPFPRPSVYDPSWYLALKRYIAAGWNDLFHGFCPLRNGKSDMNNQGPFSTDFIGMNYRYPEASYAEREQIFQAHVAYQQGLMWCWTHDPEIPAPLRDAMNEWGLAGDEFEATGHWPHALYVRESRRMLSDFVVTERHCLSEEIVDDSIALAAHGMDSHTCRRIVRGGILFNEGDVQVHGIHPYPISFRALVPKERECTNLFVPFCLSASHIAFGSIRMEPVLMVLGQSCAIAAAMALHENIPVQQVAYPALRAELERVGQVLEWKG